MDEIPLSRAQRRALSDSNLTAAVSQAQQGSDQVTPAGTSLPARARAVPAAVAGAVGGGVVALLWLFDALVTGWLPPLAWVAAVVVAVVAVAVVVYWLLRPTSSLSSRLVDAVAQRAVAGDGSAGVSKAVRSALSGLDPLPPDAAATLRRAGFRLGDAGAGLPVTAAASTAGGVLVCAASSAAITSGAAARALAELTGQLATSPLPVVVLVTDGPRGRLEGAFTCTRKDLVRVAQKVAVR